MKMLEPYKGFKPKPAPYFLTEIRGWSVRGYIERDTGECTLVKGFDAGVAFPRRMDAIEAFIEFAHAVIDGEHPNLTVSDLI